MKRFWTDVETEAEGEGWTITLDRRPIRIPARSALVVPTQSLAISIAQEWRSIGETIDPRAMPLTGLSNAAIDRIAPIARNSRPALSATPKRIFHVIAPKAQASSSNGRKKPGRSFSLGHVGTSTWSFVSRLELSMSPNPPRRSIDCGRGWNARPLISWRSFTARAIGGPLIAGLAIFYRAITAESGWLTVSLDDHWQIERWGAGFGVRSHA